MDTQLLLIIIGSSIIFFSLIGWKLIWLYKKMLAAEQRAQKSKD